MRLEMFRGGGWAWGWMEGAGVRLPDRLLRTGISAVKFSALRRCFRSTRSKNAGRGGPGPMQKMLLMTIFCLGPCV